MLPQILTDIVQLEQQGDFAAAAALCDRQLAAEPDSIPLLVLRARLARQQGELQQAAALLARVAKQAPGSAALLAEQGKLALAAGDAAGACESFQTLAAVRPAHAETWFNLGFANERAHRHSAAVAAYQKALSLGISQPEAVETRLGSVLTAMGREDEAAAHFDRALAQNSQDHEALYGKGMIRQAMGDFPGAEQLFLAAIDQNPDFAEAYQQLAESRRFDDPQDPVAVKMRGLLARPASSQAEEKLHFALGKIANDCGRYDEAFEHYDKANALKRERQPPFRRAEHEALTRSVIRYFDRAQIARQVIVATPAPVMPVFIVGMPRSGTTLVEQILATHSEVSGAGELATIDAIARHKIPDYPQGLAQLDETALQALRATYLQELSGHTAGHRVVTDKFPGNFMHLGLISKLLPEAKFIHCSRDPLDNCLSIFFQDFGSGNYYSNDLGDIAFYYRQQQAVVEHWQTLIGERILSIVYEEVVEDQERETRRLLEFLGLPWEAACLAFDKTARKVSTLSRWQVRQPIYKSAMGRRQHYAQHLGTLRAALEGES